MNHGFRFCGALAAGLLLSLNVWAQAGAALKSGEQVYQETCMACHGAGANNAPRFADKKAWGKLIREGQVNLSADGWVGVRAMPPKGGKADLDQEEFARAVVWMANAAGANWKDPDAKLMAGIRAREAKRIAALKKKNG